MSLMNVNVQDPHKLLSLAFGKMANAGLDKLAHLIKIWISNANQRLLFLDQEIEERSG